MDDDQLLRYSRHILLDDIGVEGQQRLMEAHAMVIGAGGSDRPRRCSWARRASAASRWSITTAST